MTANTAAWTPGTLGDLAWYLFALQEPGPLAALHTRELAQAQGLLTPSAPAMPAAESDAFLRRQNVLGEIGLLDL